MKKIYFWLADRFNALQSRERLVVFIGLTVLLCGLFYIAAISSLLARQQAASRQVTQSGQTLSAILQQEAQLQNLAGQNPDAEAEQTARNLQLQNNELRAQLQAAHMQLANPDNMPVLLRDLLLKQKSLQLIAMRTIPVSDILGNVKSTHDAERVSSVFKHGIEITVQGQYSDLLAYAKQLNALPWKVYQDNFVLSVERYPISTMKMSLYTLSMERAWLSY